MNAPRSDLVIIGAGTLGSTLFELTVRTARAAIEPISAAVAVCDPDRVSRHNVPKSAVYGMRDVGQFKATACQNWARRIDPDLDVRALCHAVHEIGLGPFLDAKAVLICADTYRGKLESSRAAWKAGVPLIMSGELASDHPLGGRLRWFCPGPGSPCLECGWSEEYHHLEARFSCTAADAVPGPTTRLTDAYRIASLMLDETRRILEHDAEHERAAEVRLYPEALLDPQTRHFTVLRPQFNPNCRFDHQTIRPEALVGLQGPAATLTLGDAFAVARRHLSGAARLELGSEIAAAFDCPSGHTWSALRSLSLPLPRCPQCAEPARRATETAQIGRSLLEQHADTPLSRIVPPGDLLTFTTEPGTDAVNLALPRSWHERPATGAC